MFSYFKNHLKKFLFAFIFISLGFILFLLFQIIIFQDISSEPIFIEANPDLVGAAALRPRVYLISYADGPEVYFKNQHLLALSALNKNIDTIINYRKSLLEPDFIEKNKDILALKTGAGYWLWKPYIIAKTMQEAPPNSIIIYADSGILLAKSLTSLINLMQKQKYEILLTSEMTPLMIEDTVQRQTLIKMGVDNNKALLHQKALLAGFCVFRNTPKAQAFVKSWLENSQDKEKLVNTDASLPEHANFSNHRHDQAILSVLAVLAKQNKAEFLHIMSFDESRQYWHWHHRAGERASKTLIPYILNKVPSCRWLTSVLLNNKLACKSRGWLLKKYAKNTFTPM